MANYKHLRLARTGVEQEPQRGDRNCTNLSWTLASVHPSAVKFASLR